MSNSTPKNIFIIGPQSTGKTTLVNALQRHFSSTTIRPPQVITEVARTVMSQIEIDREQMSVSPERCLALQSAIISAQFEAETILTSSRGQWYISDRSAVDPAVYANLLVGEAARQTLTGSPHWKALEQNMKEGLVFLCESGCSWLVDDGVRMMPKDDEDWAKIETAFRDVLEEHGIRYKLVQKHLSVAERVELVLEEIRRSS